MSLIKQVPTNIITGFLGAGKSTAIMHLLKSKPAEERWAVLVNEFGEVGIDGSILKGKGEEESGTFIKEVPGGCMCCAAGLPMQIALNMLLARAKPQRLLIEPTGLGHPKEVLESLRSEHYRDALDIQRTVTLVDARKLSDERYVNHETFQQQLAIADVVVANKADLYTGAEYADLKNYMQGHFPAPSKDIYKVSNGELKLQWLQGQPRFLPEITHRHSHGNTSDALKIGEAVIPASGFISVTNEGQGFYSQGWIFKPELVFNRSALGDLLLSEKTERLKAVFITDEGIIAFNKADDVLTQMPLDECSDSRIELITRNKSLLEDFESKVLACLD